MKLYTKIKSRSWLNLLLLISAVKFQILDGKRINQVTNFLHNPILKSAEVQPDSFTQSCSNVLHHGNWVKLGEKLHFISSRVQIPRNSNNNETENVPNQNTIQQIQNTRFFYEESNSTTGVTMVGNSDITWSGPETCQYKTYQPNEIKRCIKRHYNKIQFIGDSRARQYYTSLKPIISESNDTKKFIMFDSAWQLPQENRYKSESSGIQLDQAWVRKSVQMQKAWRHRYNKIEDEPNLVIITAMILHPITMTGSEAKNKELADKLRNSDYLEQEFLEAKREFKDSLIPFLTNLVKRNANMTIILMEAEQILPEVFEFDGRRNFYIRRYNGLMRALIPDQGLLINGSRKIFRVSLPNKVIDSPMGDGYFLPDRIHLARKDKAVVTPPTLLANWNSMFNLLCNRYQPVQPNQNYCCQKDI